jgi:hypothetical protein
MDATEATAIPTQYLTLALKRYAFCQFSFADHRTLKRYELLDNPNGSRIPTGGDEKS